MSRRKQLGVLESTHPDSRERMLTHILTEAQEKKKHSAYTGSDLANLRQANMICDASGANK